MVQNQASSAEAKRSVPVGLKLADMAGKIPRLLVGGDNLGLYRAASNGLRENSYWLGEKIRADFHQVA